LYRLIAVDPERNISAEKSVNRLEGELPG